MVTVIAVVFPADRMIVCSTLNSNFLAIFVIP